MLFLMLTSSADLRCHYRQLVQPLSHRIRRWIWPSLSQLLLQMIERRLQLINSLPHLQSSLCRCADLGKNHLYRVVLPYLS